VKRYEGTVVTPDGQLVDILAEIQYRNAQRSGTLPAAWVPTGKIVVRAIPR
jgi:hypothetical protein